jgi:hypothetical protein
MACFFSIKMCFMQTFHGTQSHVSIFPSFEEEAVQRKKKGRGEMRD